jgi:predicted Zn-dependent peptidase
MRLALALVLSVALVTNGLPAPLTGGLPRASGAVPAATATVHRLPNGLRVVLKEIPGSGLVAASLVVGAAPRVEESARAGISVLMREVALQGTATRTADQIAGALESVGGNLRALTGFDNTQWAALTRPEHVDLALDLLADLVTNATFPPAALETQRRIAQVRLRQQQESPQSRAVDLSLARLYPLHPYGTPILGTPETLAALTRDDLLAYYQAVYTAPNMVLALVGDLRAPDALAKAARAFAGLRATPVPRRLRLLRAVEPALTPRPEAPVEVREPRRTAAAWIAIGYVGVRAEHRDWAPLQVLTTILGSGLSSRLFVEIRDRQGLVYSIGSGFGVRAAGAPVLMSAGTDPVNAPRVVQAMLAEVERFKNTPVSAEELDRGRNRVVGLFSIDQEDLRQQAFSAAWYELLGIGQGYQAHLASAVAAVAAADVQRVARTYLVNPAVAVVLPPGP